MCYQNDIVGEDAMRRWFTVSEGSTEKELIIS